MGFNSVFKGLKFLLPIVDFVPSSPPPIHPVLLAKLRLWESDFIRQSLMDRLLARWPK